MLPLNFQGSQLGDAREFGHTTLANLSPSLPGDAVYLWVHVFLAFIMFPVAILLMRKFSKGLKMTDTDLKITRTLAIGKIFIEIFLPLVNTISKLFIKEFAQIFQILRILKYFPLRQRTSR